MLLPRWNLTAEVEAVDVVAQFGNFRRSGVEVVARIERVVAEILPSRSVELLGPGLDDRRDRRGGGQAVLGAVVRGHVLELGDRVDGRGDTATATATVQVLAAVNQLKIVPSSLAVNTHVVVGTDRSEWNPVRLNAGCTWRERKQRVQRAPVDTKIRYLCSVNDRADFAGVSLHSDCIRLDSHLLLRATDLQLEVDTTAVADGQNDVLLLGGLETARRHAHAIAPDDQIWRHVLTVAVGGRITRHAGFGVRDDNGGIGNCRACRVSHGAQDGRFLSQGLSGEDYEESCEQNRKARAIASDSQAETPGKHGRERFHVEPPN